MSPSTSYARALERVARVCDAHDESRALRSAIVDEMRRVLGFEAYVWVLTDPETEVGASPLADIPSTLSVPRVIRLKYLTSVNRWTELDKTTALLRAATDEQPHLSLIWREELSAVGVNDVASLVFRDSFGCWGFLDLWRMHSGPRFTEAEAAFLTHTTPAITAALRRSQACTFQLQSAAAVRSGPIVLVLSAELEVKAQTHETEQYLRILIPPQVDRRPIPAGAYNVAAQLLANEAGIDDHPPTARVHLASGSWLTLRAARIADDRSTEEQDIAVTIELTSPPERMTLFARACGLSARETELVRHLAGGADTREVAKQMFLSENTVQDHLKSIFAKTGTRNRPGLLTRALGR